ncbi:MAG: HEAT repeat domain-containing protein [Myxococcales bacterium]|nr:HEAT repeat domain-containing protein [Myxococcales bacterium]
MLRGRAASLTGLTVLVLWQLACGGLIGSEGDIGLPLHQRLGALWGEIPLEKDLDESAAMAATALADRVSDARFPDETALDCEAHAERFTWLAARHPSPSVQTASLWAMAGCEEALHAPDAQTVAAAHLQSEHRDLLGGALAVSRLYVAELDEQHPVVQGLVELAVGYGEMPVRIEAVEALDERTWSQEPTVSVAFYDALLADNLPSLTATALQRLQFRGAGLTVSDKPRFQAAAMVLASDIDPGIRGFAALALARLDPRNEDVRGRVLSLLDDRHPYTRSAAAEALADMEYLPAVHELIERIDDQERNVWRMLPFTRLDGDQDRMRFVGSHFERVDDAYLRALERLSSEIEDPYRYREINLRYKHLDIVAATRDAKRWYVETGSYLPRRGIDDEEPDAQAEVDGSEAVGVADDEVAGQAATAGEDLR